MIIKPMSSFTEVQQVADHPGLVAYWHQDDVTAGDTTWVDRVTGLTLNSTVAFSKDSDGVYCASSPTFTMTGTMPIAGLNALILNIFKPVTGSATLGSNVTIGYIIDATTYAGPGISTAGGVSDGTGGSNTGATATLATTPATTDLVSCRANHLVSGAARVVALANTGGATETIGTDNDATTGTLTAIATTPLGTDALTFQGLYHATGGQRTKVIALYNLGSPLAATAAAALLELEILCVECARTEQLPARLRNRS